MEKKNICNIKEWSVNWNELGNELICTHEYMHEFLTITSIYGIIQQQIKIYCDYYPNNLQLKRIQYELFKNSLFIQESHATFCSVMQVSNDINNKEQLLTTSYLDFFNSFYNRFRNVIKSTYFAYIFAEVIAQACMNNLIHEDILNILNNNSPINIRNTNKPDYLFMTILEELSDNTINDIINFCNSKNDDTHSDINNDVYWKNLDISHIINLNDIIFTTAYDYLCKLIENLKLVTLEELNKNSLLWLDLLCKTLESKYGNIERVVGLGVNRTHPYILSERLLLALECIDTTKIYNKPPLRSKEPLPSPLHIGVNSIPNHKKMNLHTYLCENCFYDTNGNWYKFDSDGVHNNATYFHYNSLHKLLFPNPLFVVGIMNNKQTNDILSNEIYVIKKNILTLCKNNKIDNINSYNIMFYMFGRFSLWLDYLALNGESKLSILSIEDKNSSIPNVTHDFAMIAFYSSSLPGIFIKCFNILNYSKTLQIIDSLIQQKFITRKPGIEHKIVGPKMKQAFDAIDSLWLEY